MFHFNYQEAPKGVRPTREEIEAACRLAQIQDVIDKLPSGRSTVVGERGVHAELLARGGLYARLCEQQFGAGAVAPEAPAG